MSEAIAITTCRLKGLPHHIKEALVHDVQKMSSTLGLPYIERKAESLEAIANQICNNLKTTQNGGSLTGPQKLQLIVLTKEGLQLYHQGTTISWHPNMLEFRIRGLMAGGLDPMVQAMGLDPSLPNTILDCTLGYGADAAVAAHAGGPHTLVVGLESNLAIAKMTEYGFAHYGKYAKLMPQTQTALERITVKIANYEAYLTNLKDKSFDVVYFDPMFEETLEGSIALKHLRGFANTSPISKEAWYQALRVAKKNVVIKLPASCPALKEAPFIGLTTFSRKGSPIVYLQKNI